MHSENIIKDFHIKPYKSHSVLFIFSLKEVTFTIPMRYLTATRFKV